MKENYIHVCLIIDESGSMSGSETDIVGGFNKVIEEQKANKEGQCSVSLFTFNNDVKERFVGKNVSEVKEFKKGSVFTNVRYSSTSFTYTNINNVVDVNYEEKEVENDPLYEYTPRGGTRMNDGIGTAIDRIGKWLSEMPEDERPSKNLIVIMTDGEENISREYTLKQVKEMIEHQTEKYNWTFVYMGMDVTKVDTAENLGINVRSYASKSCDDMSLNYLNTTTAINAYRCATGSVFAADAALKTSLDTTLKETTKSYEDKLGIKIEQN